MSEIYEQKLTQLHNTSAPSSEDYFKFGTIVIHSRKGSHFSKKDLLYVLYAAKFL